MCIVFVHNLELCAMEYGFLFFSLAYKNIGRKILNLSKMLHEYSTNLIQFLKLQALLFKMTPNLMIKLSILGLSH